MTHSGGGEDFPFAGSATVGDVAWYEGNNGAVASPTYGTKDVCTRARNGLQLCDMNGNVWEWTWDWFDATSYDAAGRTDPLGGSAGVLRISRGGAWDDSERSTRIAYRLRVPPSHRNFQGVRLIRTAD